MIRRPRRSVPATIVALVLLAAAVLTVIAVVQSLVGQTPLVDLAQLLAVGSSQHWNSAAVVTAAIVVAMLGLILLIAAIRPGNPTVLPLIAHIGAAPASPAGVRRQSLATDLASTVSAVPGVSRASVTARRHRVIAQISVAAADPAAVPGQVRQRLENRIAEIGPATRVRVRVRARRDTTT